MAEAIVSTVAELRAALNNSTIDSIKILPGSYYVNDSNDGASGAGFVISRNVSISTLSSDDTRAEFYARTEFGKGMFLVQSGVSATFTNINVHDTGKNWGGSIADSEAVIRHEGVNLTIIGSNFTDILRAVQATGSPNAGALLIRDSSFVNPSYTFDGTEHLVYAEFQSIDIENTNFLGHYDGHAIKSISNYTRIVNNTISDNGYNRSGAPIDIEGGGTAIIEGNTITKSVNDISGGGAAGNPHIIFIDGVRSNDDTASTHVSIKGNTIYSGHVSAGGHPDSILVSLLSGVPATVENNVLTGTFALNDVVRGAGALSGNTLNGNAVLAGNAWKQSSYSLTESDDSFVLNVGSGIYNGQYSASYNALGGNDHILTASSGTNRKIVFGGAGNDYIEGGQSHDFLYGEDGNDTLLTGAAGGARDELLSGGAGDDMLVAQGTTNRRPRLLGGDGADILDATQALAGGLSGGDGNDILIGAPSPVDYQDAFSGGYGDDIIYGNDGVEQYIYGGAGVDTFVYKGAYGTDLKIEWMSINDQRVESLSALGSTEVGGAGKKETLHEIEYIQFSNGVYDVASQQFSHGVVRVDLDNDVLAHRYGANGGSIPYPITTNIVPYAQDHMIGTGANDCFFISSASGNTLARGLGGNDHMIDEIWNSAVTGGAGSDVIEIRNYAKVAGDDEIDIYGGLVSTAPIRAADYFVFNFADYKGASYTLDPAYKWAIIQDFDNGLDKIALLEGGGGLDSFNDLTITQIGADTKISAAGVPHILLKNVQASSIDASDFIFNDNGGGAGQLGVARQAFSDDDAPVGGLLIESLFKALLVDHEIVG